MIAKLAVLIGSMLALTLPPAEAGGLSTDPPIEANDEEASSPQAPPGCEGRGCASVVSIQYQGKEWEPLSEDTAATYMGAREGITVGTSTAPVVLGDAALDKGERIWTVTVRFRGGVTETIPQMFQPLFKRGDWVLVEGDSIQRVEE
jgi:hypothetical protein